MPNNWADKLIMFSVIGLVAWAIIGLPALQYIPHPWFEHPSEWFVAVFTGLLVFVTFRLVVSTNRLWQETRATADRQERTTKILERPYLSVEVAGINPFRSLQQSVGHVVLGHVDFHNAGRLPAREISCCVKILQSDNENEPIASFPIEERDFFGNFVLPAGGRMRHGSSSIQLTQQGFIFVWGCVRYLDGFGNRRFAKFCHRYPRIMLHRLNGAYGIDSGDGRYHVTGNSTDEDE
jgi:hypothetical protein